MTLYLFKNVKLTPEYKDVFRSKDILTYYLNSCEIVATVTSDDFYWQLEGDFRMQLSTLKDYPNYAMIQENNNPLSFYFISNFEIRNGIQTFHYTCDIWHTYAIYDIGDYSFTDFRFSIVNGNRILTNLDNAPERKILTKPVTDRAPYIIKYNMNQTMTSSPSDKYCILYNGYMFTGVNDMGGPSTARPFMGYVRSVSTPSGTGESVREKASVSDMQTMLNTAGNPEPLVSFSDYQDAVDYATRLFSKVSEMIYTDGKTDNYAQIAHCYIIQHSMVDALDNALWPCDAWITCNNNGDYYAYAYLGVLHTYTVSGAAYDEIVVAPFLTEMPKTSNGGSILNAVMTKTRAETYNPITIYGEFGQLAYIGTLQNNISMPYAKYDTNVSVVTRVIMSTASIGVELDAFGQVADLSNDFEFDINFTPESALTAVQRENVAKRDTASMINSVISSAVGIAAGVMTLNPGMLISSTISGASTIATSISSYALARQQEYSNVASSPVTNPTLTQYHGLCLQIIPALNIETITYEYLRYGTAIDILEDDISLSNETYDETTEKTTYPYQYTIVAYKDVQVYGSAPGNVLNVIQRILIDGTRIWNEAFSGEYRDGKIRNLKLPALYDA